MEPFLCCFLLLWLRSLSARRQAIKTRRRRLQEARRRINGLRNRAKKRSALLALVITSLQSSSLVKRRYWVVPTRYVATKVIQVQHSFDFRSVLDVDLRMCYI